MTWHMQHEDRENMMTGCSDIRRWIRVSTDSTASKDKEEEEEVAVGGGGLRSRLTASFEQRRSPCIARD